VALAVVFGGCQVAPVTTPAASIAITEWEAATVPGLNGRLTDGLAWLGEQLVVSISAPEGGVTDFRMSLVDPASGAPSSVSLGPTSADCARFDEYSPTRGDEGSVAWLWRCTTRAGERTHGIALLRDPTGSPVVGLTLEEASVVHSLALSSVEPIAGFASVGTRICETVIRFDAEMPADEGPLSLTVEIDGKQFSLDHPNAVARCAETGLTGYPATSENGELLAFLASATTIGKNGPERLAEPMWLQTASEGAEASATHPFYVRNPGGLAIAPDGGAVLLSGIGPDGLPGSFVYRFADRSVTRIADTILISPHWGSAGIVGMVRSVPDSMAADVMVLREP
jgi:hypothetical protein